jgi:hypothetical protein
VAVRHLAVAAAGAIGLNLDLLDERMTMILTAAFWQSFHHTLQGSDHHDHFIK